jgi:hypothetical protein
MVTNKSNSSVKSIPVDNPTTRAKIRKALQIKGVYQTLFGCILQIIKQAAESNIVKRINPTKLTSTYPGNGIDSSAPKSTSDMKKVIKDNAQAGIPASLGLFKFFIVIKF